MAEAAVMAAECVHVFDIPPPNGPTTEGACRKCGMVREMRNTPLEEYNTFSRPVGNGAAMFKPEIARKHGGRGRFTKAQREDAVQAVNRGRSLEDVSAEYGCSESSLYQWVRQWRRRQFDKYVASGMPAEDAGKKLGVYPAVVTRWAKG